MATRHRYQFECGHAANTTNEFALASQFTLVNPEADTPKVEKRVCPRCNRRIMAAWERCLRGGRQLKSQPLPEAEAE